MEYIVKQSKLSRAEWESIEVPLDADEKRILGLIQDGFKNVNITRNYTPTLLFYMKLTLTPAIELYVYKQYFEKTLQALMDKYKIKPLVAQNNSTSASASAAVASAAGASASVTLKKADVIRVENTAKHIDEHKQIIFEFVIMDLLEKFLKNKFSGNGSNVARKKSPSVTEPESRSWMFYYYTLYKLLGYKVEGCNTEFRRQVQHIMAESVRDGYNIKNMLTIGQELIEKNEYLLKYADETLYDHQKQLFTICKQPNPKLILYIAPTGTGKTMSPLGLASTFKIIFVCAARHVGLALAKAAISMQKKIAFAFGCKDAEDIRLHYYAAKEFTRNEKSGGIGKVNNAQGEKVEIIISDVQSYLPAMLYMLAFNPKEKIILYWDEPTITMDYPTHDLHEIIRKNWTENLIPNVVLSSATLPQQREISETITDFCSRFVGVDVHEIVSYDCKKTIPLINREGFVEMPHYLYDDYSKIQAVVEHCKTYKTLLRYLDLQEAIQFILSIKPDMLQNNRYEINTHFTDIDTLNMYSIKMFYLDLLGNLQPSAWSALYGSLHSSRKPKYVSNVNIVTTDAHTLTDGPTIFLADDVNKIAQFYIQSANIPEYVTKNIMETINYNHRINEQVNELERKMEDELAVDDDDSKGTEKKKQKEDRLSPEMKQQKMKMMELRGCIKMVMLNPIYVPNTNDHLNKYAPSQSNTKQAFTSNISESVVEQIMQIDDIADYWKLLLMMGIGVFASHKSTSYVELMKRLAQEHKLYMIIASTDYIYGTNYQLCHGYIGKDLGNMSQEKCIQAMGRVGRNKLQQNYTVRFRDNDLIHKLFHYDENKPEVQNMNRLFNTGG
jgi:hypothetical protein